MLLVFAGKLSKGDFSMQGFKKIILSRQGFTLIEMMVVGIILSVLMLGFSSYMFQQARQGKTQENKQNYTQLKSNLLNTSSQSDSLTASESLKFSDL